MNNNVFYGAEYKVKFGKYTLTIIDTPGFGDSRGRNKDIQN